MAGSLNHSRTWIIRDWLNYHRTSGWRQYFEDSFGPKINLSSGRHSSLLSWAGAYFKKQDDGV